MLTPNAGVAQLVEQLICNHQVVSSNLITGSIISLVTTILYKKRRTATGAVFLRVGLIVGLS